mmetsp:Transcript_898/g.1959  ORF Transcript_898/g.1959 Transcript_898/m.1959 type:complete len:86 (-) Transcript_898:188-445(-)
MPPTESSGYRAKRSSSGRFDAAFSSEAFVHKDRTWLTEIQVAQGAAALILWLHKMFLRASNFGFWARSVLVQARDFEGVVSVQED